MGAVSLEATQTKIIRGLNATVGAQALAADSATAYMIGYFREAPLLMTIRLLYEMNKTRLADICRARP
jgi:hypothetical protein